jgi:RNA polymerase sigma-70 factor (ECF subfamily)
VLGIEPVEETWESLVQQHAEGVVNAALRVLGNSVDAEDVAQEVFVEAFQRWPANANHSWSGLLRRMAVCRSLDHLRRQKHHETFPDDVRDRSQSESVDRAIAGELEERLRLALLMLPPREAQVFCLHYYERLDHGEIANALGITRGAVAKSLCAARTKLASAFSETAKHV